MTSGSKFIAVEGLDGCGKSTLIQHIARHLEETGIACHLTREPSDGRIGRLIRMSMGEADARFSDDTLALLFAADRLAHLQQEIEPALAASKVVITDRYVMSSLAYQSVNLPLSWVQTLNAHARPPDLTFFIRVSPETARRRRAARGQDASQFENDDFQTRVSTRFEEVLSLSIAGKTCIIDGEQETSVVVAQVTHEMNALLQPGEAFDG